MTWIVKNDNACLRKGNERRRLKKIFHTYDFGISHLYGTIQCVRRNYNLPLLNMLRMRSVPNRNTKNYPFWFKILRQRRIWSFHVPVLQRTAKKCTKIYNARAQPLICSLNLLSGDVLFAVPVGSCVAYLPCRMQLRQ